MFNLRQARVGVFWFLGLVFFFFPSKFHLLGDQGGWLIVPIFRTLDVFHLVWYKKFGLKIQCNRWKNGMTLIVICIMSLLAEQFNTISQALRQSVLSLMS